MYTPAEFSEKDSQQLIAAMRENPFATLITSCEGGPVVSHLPLLIEERDDGIVLLGHMARANPHWKQLSSGETLAIFHGPQAYITPRWYKDDDNVPTWNYVVVHAQGRASVVEDACGLGEILKKSTVEFEKNEANPWSFDAESSFQSGLLGAIVGFEIAVIELEGKFKLNQNRTEADRQGVIEGLLSRTDEGSRRVREMMLKAKPWNDATL